MESQRFDQITRAFGTAHSRRQLLKTVAGIAAAGVLSSLGFPQKRGVAAGGLLAPVDAGVTLKIIHGYNDPPVGQYCPPKGPNRLDHCGNQKYGLDFLPDQDGFDILAPTGGSVALISGECLFLQLDQGNVNLTICHFDPSSYKVKRGDRVSRGDCLGKWLGSNYHLSLDDRYNQPQANPFPPIPFTGAFTIEGQSFPPLADSIPDQHDGESLPASTNQPTAKSCSAQAKPCPASQQQCANGKCLPTCTGGHTFDAANCACFCPANTTECKGSCVATCAGGQSLDAKTCQCVAAPAPTITDTPKATIVAATAATIEWHTDQPADSRIDYGLKPSALTQSTSRSDPVTDHQLTLSGLQPGTTYDFKVTSTNTNGTASKAGTPFKTQTLACPRGQTACGSGCADLTSDPSNCGTCGTYCSSGFCLNKTCCPAGTDAICSTSGTARCVNTKTDGQNCNGCGKTCASNETCQNGSCVAAASCPPDQLPCGSMCCAAPANATATCSNGQCGFACQPGFADCDGSPATGCETALGTGSNCLKCGDACGTTNPCAVALCDPTKGCYTSPVLDGTACVVNGIDGTCQQGLCEVGAYVCRANEYYDCAVGQDAPCSSDESTIHPGHPRCLCSQITEGGNACIVSITCDAPRCASSADCAPGHVCLTAVSACGCGGTCVPLCETEPCLGASDGTACTLGGTAGSCQSGQCVAATTPAEATPSG